MISLLKHFCIFSNILQNHTIFVYKAWFAIISYQKRSKYFLYVIPFHYIHSHACRRMVISYVYAFFLYLYCEISIFCTIHIFLRLDYLKKYSVLIFWVFFFKFLFTSHVRKIYARVLSIGVAPENEFGDLIVFHNYQFAHFSVLKN